jgi:ATP phosphoribosyltransferase regulatory subunit
VLASPSVAAHNPLPPGMRDVLPPKARFQSRVGARIMKSFELFGYARVWLPTFEYAEVLERTPSGGGALRFVEPESGEVVALRADMTPQVARVVSTRYRTQPLPVRLCYQGSVLRRRRERARTESQVVQAGIELVGSSGLEADFEVLAALSAAVKAAGLRRFVISIGHAGIPDALLRGVASAERSAVGEALAAKDTLVLSHLAQRLGLGRQAALALVGLAELHGGPEVYEPAARLLRGTSAESAGLQLRALCERVIAAGLAPNVIIDFGETSRRDYYTGPLFQVLAEGPGEALASGGRYDHLYPRYGLEREAAGCALDVNNVCWALDAEGFVEPEFPKVVLPRSASYELLMALRSEQTVCAVAEGAAADYAKSWGWDFWLEAETTPRIVAQGGESRTLSATSPSEQAREILAFLRSVREERASGALTKAANRGS